ncbi:M28 family metallopeptidase [Flavobacteriaceae bacterium F08102]|nr:M28 family metallopeptidase [Flavobacteriaceae bacterium F08102]
MKKLFTLVVIAALMVSCGSSQKSTTQETAVTSQKTVTDFANSITSANLKEMLYVYASDEFEGRETGTPGQKKAVNYIKKHYVDLGIPAALGGDNYFQKVALETQGEPDVTFKIGDIEYAMGDDFVPYRCTTGTATSNELVYVGYGIEDGNYNSYKGVDVAGKIVVIKGGEPKKKDGTYVISGSSERSKWSNNRQQMALKSQLADAKGAAAVLFYDPEFYKLAAPQLTNFRGRISLKTGDAKKEIKKMNFFMINTKVADAIMPDLLNKDKSVTIKMPASISYVSGMRDVDSENVVAFIKGSEKPDEYIVISSHLDHIGINNDGQINNGADDDGSGSVALLEIAKAFKLAADNGQGPKRSVVFLHVTGEEKGLLGSKYYTDYDPIFPLANTVANLNIDMIGRIDPKREGNRNYIYLIGSDKLSTELHNLSEEVNKKYTNIELDYTYNDENDPNRFYYRSDHYNFAKNNIPIIFYFNGTHDDYHQPTDTPDKIEYDLLENRTKLVFYTAWELANRPNRVVVDKAGK